MDLTGTWQDEEAILAKSIFGTTQQGRVREMLARWLERHLVARAHGVLSFEMSVGAGISVRLAGGRDIFLKVWPGSAERAGLAAQL